MKQQLPEIYTRKLVIPFLNDNSRLYEVYSRENEGEGIHDYVVSGSHAGSDPEFLLFKSYQKGPVTNGVNGLLSVIDLQILIDHLKSFQTGSLGTRETALAITHLEEAYNWIARRADDRFVRGVINTYNK